jgi:hypothetical protein
VTRVVAAGLAIALGLACAVLASDVRSWRSSLARGDAHYASSTGRVAGTPDTRLGGIARSLLGVRDDVDARRALERYRAVAHLRLRLDNALAVQTARAGAQDALTLLGVLSFGGSATGAQQDQVDAAMSDFVDAIRADPGDNPAKFDLELLLRQSAAFGTRIGQGLGGAFGRGGHRGAGGGTPGRGY